MARLCALLLLLSPLVSAGGTKDLAAPDLPSIQPSAIPGAQPILPAAAAAAGAIERAAAAPQSETPAAPAAQASAAEAAPPSPRAQAEAVAAQPDGAAEIWTGAKPGRSAMIDQFEQAAADPALRLFPDRNFLASFHADEGQFSETSRYVLSRPRKFYVAFGAFSESISGVIRLNSAAGRAALGGDARKARELRERAQEIGAREKRARRMLGANVVTQGPAPAAWKEQVDAVAAFLHGKGLSAADAVVAADVFFACPPGERCAILTYDRGFRQLSAMASGRAAAEFRRLIAAFPDDVRGRVGSALPETVLLRP